MGESDLAYDKEKNEKEASYFHEINFGTSSNKVKILMVCVFIVRQLSLCRQEHLHHFKKSVDFVCEVFYRFRKNHGFHYEKVLDLVRSDCLAGITCSTYSN